MKQDFITGWRQLDGGFSVEEKAELKTALGEVQTALETKNKEAIDAAVKAHLPTINEGIKKLEDRLTQKDADDKANQAALDKVIAQLKENRVSTPKEMKSFQQAFAEELVKPENVDGLKGVSKQRSHIMKIPGFVSMKDHFETIETKTVGDMTLSNLTGYSVATYRTNPALIPSAKINFRDILPTVRSATGLYVTYAEGAGEGAVGIQTEGSAKSQVDSDFTEVKTVNKFVAGFARFSKQMARSLPFLQNTLPRILLRKFFVKENRYFYDTIISGATGSGTSANTVHIKKLIDWIASQQQANYNASYAVVSWIQMGELLNELVTNGNYFGAGSVVGLPNGAITIAGVPVVPASWVPSNDVALIYDTDFVERVEVEGIQVEFFEQDADNVTKNLTTARIECYEELNRMDAASVILGDMGDTATS